MGYVIVIEGTDGSGKQTQAELLYNRLLQEGYKVIKQSFPNYDKPYATLAKLYLDGDFGDTDMSLDAYQASVLFSVDRLCTYKKYLEQFYNEGGILILDRYVQSNMLHQAGKIADKASRDKYIQWLDDLEFNLLKLPRADKVVFLDVPVEVSTRLAIARGKFKANTKKDIHEQNPEHLSHAYESGKYVSNLYGWEEINCVRNGELRTKEDIHEEIYNRIIADINNL